jgi:methionine aminotransferase
MQVDRTAVPLRRAASKLPRVGTTIFTVMSQLAATHRAINLGQGFPDFNCDPRLQGKLADAVRAGHNQYAPMAGVPALRETIARKNEALYDHRHDPDSEITVTAGATQAIMTAVLALVHPGDEVVVLEPVYDSYVPAIELARGIPVRPARPRARYAPDWERRARRSLRRPDC